MTPEARAVMHSGGDDAEDTAADVVQCALGRLTRGEVTPTLDDADEVAAALQEAVLEGAVPLTSVIAVSGTAYPTKLASCARVF